MPASPTAAAPMARFCGRDHLGQHPARAVGAGQQRRRQVRLVGGGDLQRAEQRVGRGVRAGDRGAEPADQRREEGEEAAGAGRPGAERDRLTREVHHVGEREHGHDGHDRPPQLDQRAPVDPHGVVRADPQHERGEDAGDEQPGAGGGQVVELERLARRRLALRAQHVQAGPVNLLVSVSSSLVMPAMLVTPRTTMMIR